MKKRCVGAVVLGLWAVSGFAWAGKSNPYPLPEFEYISLHGFRPDGGFTLTASEHYGKSVLRNGELADGPSTDFLVVVDAQGNVQQLSRASESGEGKNWNRAAKRDPKALRNLPEAAPSRNLGETSMLSAGPGAAGLRVNPVGPVGNPNETRCGAKVEWIQKDLPVIPIQVGSFVCNDEAGYDVAVLWNANGTRAAIAINQCESFSGTSTCEAAFSFLSPKDRARIDLLDAGAGERMAKFQAAVTQAGFAVAHTGKTSGKHASTGIFAASGYEDVARELAKATGLPESAVKALDWESGYPIVVALTAN